MTSRRLHFKKRILRDYYPMSISTEALALQKSSEIISIIYSSNQSTAKIHFTRKADQTLMRQVHYVGFVLANYINCGPRGEGVPEEVAEAFCSWSSVEPKLRQLLLKIEDGAF
ncbi:E4 ORFC [Bovine mastadenovirus A]|uniref:E4 ORFC n=1 Tax=Bovine mastadenovirus A TaxID=129953 RepID=UPI0000443F9F|nr:E4 ORFC [Bovine mastadenovirus A]